MFPPPTFKFENSLIEVVDLLPTSIVVVFYVWKDDIGLQEFILWMFL